MGSDMALTAARASASAGHVPPWLSSLLASPNADIIQHRLNWTLRFPLPCARQKFHDLLSCHIPSTRNTGKVAVSCFSDQDGSKGSWKKLISFHCGQGVILEDDAFRDLAEGLYDLTSRSTPVELYS